MVGLKKPVEYEDCALPAYRLFITGLKGGHSGSCIILELGNSLKICGRILKEISGSSDLRIVSLDGGLKNNAIPRECEAVFASGAPREQIERAMESITAEIRNELKFQEPELSVTLETAACTRAMSEETSADLVDLMYLLPTDSATGAFRSRTFRWRQKTWRLYGVRRIMWSSSIPSGQKKCPGGTRWKRNCASWPGIYDMTVDVYSKFPSWEFNPDSALRNTLLKAYKEVKGTEMELLATHGGLECGVFCDMIPGLDVVTLGAETDGAHTPQEQMNLKSFDQTFEVLKNLLERL